MRLCALRAALSVNRDADGWVLHSPRAWLGTAFHRLIAARPASEEEAASLWESTVRQFAKLASMHSLNARFANPERWPGYFLMRQRSIASSVRAGRKAAGNRSRYKPVVHVSGSEQLLTARNGRLAGRPDRFEDGIVTEFKSSLPSEAWSGAAAVIDGYWRQLRLYAVLIGESGSWPSLARIAASNGQVLERGIVRPECDAEADQAVYGLEILNRSLASGSAGSELASPSEAGCAECPYQAVCPAFWKWCAEADWPVLPEAAGRGRVVSADAGSDGDVYSISILLDGRLGRGGPQSLALRKSVHGDMTGSEPGTAIRIVAARTWPDDRLGADISTCVFREDDLPAIVCAGSE
ncbi:MAG TPA: PD-(D/E)XK nuclease family protein [Acidobacteriaceae bacterium]|nr:PD-(D/E)XK nuclease family protein [Acidobacteriaceae bacterium]